MKYYIILYNYYIIVMMNDEHIGSRAKWVAYTLAPQGAPIDGLLYSINLTLFQCGPSMNKL